ncbi:WGR domain-containing protein [Lysinibacillus sp. BPa_S21]|uniref:WGR domain-containing protein n=1 Tax=Lysinibacillus sp. BPa_S21 TaxID=2932478 RepID=UPI0024B38F3D
MKKAFTYQDEKSNKFWTIDYFCMTICVHYGKNGTIGKYDMKEFESQEICEKEAQKLIASKIKKGYQENPTFDFDNCLYFDVGEFGPHPKTSHPRFVAHFTEEFYYDCGDEEAPFGSDEGSDTLYELEEVIRKKRIIDFATFPKHLIENIWGMHYISIDTLDEKAIRDMAKEHEMDMIQSDMITYATAFGQIKITGKLDTTLKKNALLALKRLAIMYSDGQLTETQQTMYNDLLTF